MTIEEIYTNGSSNCCGAKVIDPSGSGVEGTCSDCKEPCGIVVELEDESPDVEVESEPVKEAELKNATESLQ